MASRKRAHVKKGDRVLVLTGKDRSTRDRPRMGEVIEVQPGKGRVVVAEINVQKRHVKPTQKVPQGGIMAAPGPLDASNVMLVCPHCQQPTRPRQERAADGTKVRVCRRADCGRQIDER
jgi:large subunit ribosomal protein L24